MGNLWWTDWLVEDANKATVSEPPLKAFLEVPPVTSTYSSLAKLCHMDICS